MNEKFGNIDGAEARMREGGLELLVDSLEEGAFISSGQADIRRLEDGILITLPTNPFVKDKVSFLGIEFFIPLKNAPKSPKVEEPADEA